MILIGLGSNVEGPWGPPEDTVRAALERMDGGVIKIAITSRLLRSKPLGLVDQPDFINAAARITTNLPPEKLMRFMHDLELAAERRRTVRWGPRTLDLDLLDYEGMILQGDGEAKGHQKPLVLPHPRIPERAFVLAPIREIAPDWRHPVTRSTAAQMLAELAPESSSCEFLPAGQADIAG